MVQIRHVPFCLCKKIEIKNLKMIWFTVLLFVIILFGAIEGINYVNASHEMVTDDSPGIIMKVCANNPLKKDFNSETVSGSEIFLRCVEIDDGYSWGSRAYVLIYAPSWNTNPDKLDIIGNDQDNPITATSREGSMTLAGNGCNGFIETGTDHGVFYGSIKLSGFRHDITGDGIPDLFGGNRCERNTSILDDGSGRVESKQEGALTITWEYDKNQHISKTITHTWREAVLEFDKKSYDVHDEVNLVLNDLDNLRWPFDDDKVYEVRVYSDTDSRGITLDALWKTDFKGIPQRTGTYPVSFTLTDNKESRDNDRLRITPGDTIYAEYWDYTLPKPYMVNDRKKITVDAQVKSAEPNKMIITDSKITDLAGNQLHHCNKGEKAIIKTELFNKHERPLSVSVITQVKDPDGLVQKIFWSTVTAVPNQVSSVQSDFEVKKDGTHIFEVYVWDSITNAQSLADSVVTKI